eukprot:scaffold40987_cov69-Phaeocystis_antarctica.AAC.2
MAAMIVRVLNTPWRCAMAMGHAACVSEVFRVSADSVICPPSKTKCARCGRGDNMGDNCELKWRGSKDT